MDQKHITRITYLRVAKRITIIFLFFLLSGLTSAFAMQDTVSVNLKKQEITIARVFKVLQEQTGFIVFYNNQLLNDQQKVDVNFNHAGVRQVMDYITKRRGLTYIIKGRFILLRKKKAGNSFLNKSKENVNMPFAVVDTVITGKVMNDAGKPLIGVSVGVKGTSSGTITGTGGKFSISVSDLHGSLIFSYVGYSKKEIAINGRRSITVVMKASVSSLDQLIVVGYGKQKKKDLTGAVSTITSKDIEGRSVNTLAKAMQGADPSLNITYGTGVPDQGYGINIRGVPSINGGTPLILMDGVQVNLNEINPHNVASVTILKDAAASAIYGAKASSGVILITTKSGKDLDGKPIISYEGRYGISENTTSTDFIRKGYNHVQLVNSFYKVYKGYDMALYDDQDMKMLYDRRNDLTENPDRPWVFVKDDGKYYYYGNTDWYGYFYRRQRPQQEHNISASGGSDNIKYYVSGRYLSQDGIFNIYHDNYKNYSFFSKLNANIKPWLHYTGIASYNNSIYKYAGYYDPQFTIRALQSNILSSFVPRNPDGTIVQYSNQLHSNSPLGAGHAGFLTANEARNSRGNKYIVLSNRLDVDVLHGLTLTAVYAYKHRERRNKYRNMPFEYSREEGVLTTFKSGTIYDYYYEDHFDVNDQNLNIYTTYNNTFNDDHHLNVVIGGQYENYNNVDLGVKQLGQLSNDLSSFNLGTGEVTLNQSINTFRTLGFFSRVNYNYKERYLLQLSGRYDGTSRFQPTDRWGFFPSMALGWVMSEENFWRSIKKIFNYGKLRLSYGSLGNQQVDYYAYIPKINPSNAMSYTFDGESSAFDASISDPKSASLTWETVTTYDLGLDIQSLDNRLAFTGDVFIRNTRNMLAQSLTLPNVFGAPTPLGNVASLETKGYEFKIEWKDNVRLFNKDLRYDISATLGNYSTVITKFHNPDKLISDWYVGRKFGDIWGYRVKGLFATDEDAARYQLKVNDKQVNHRVYASKEDNFLQAGDVEFMDLNGDGIINQGAGTVSDPGDKRVIGNSQPKYNYSIRLSADWFNIDISIFLQGIGKRDWWPTQNAYDFWGPYSFPSLSFISKSFLSNTWSKDNPNAYFPRIRGYDSYSDGALGVPNDRYIQNVAYLRLKNVVVGYTIPLKKTFINKLRVYFSGENLYYWSKLKRHAKTVDPELTITGATYDTDSGVGYPFSKSFNFGVRLTF